MPNPLMIAISVLTFVLCALCFPTLGWFIKNEITRSKQESDKRHSELSESILKLEKCLDRMQGEVSKKVNREECDSWSQDKWDRIYHHTHLPDGKVVVTN